MVFIAIAGVLLSISMSIMIAAITTRKSRTQFDANKSTGKAVVCGYEQGPGTGHISSLIVHFEDDEDKINYSCPLGKGTNAADYPVGTIVDVIYAPVVMFGINSCEVRLKDFPPPNSKSYESGFKTAAVILFIISLALIGTGIWSIIYQGG